MLCFRFIFTLVFLSSLTLGTSFSIQASTDLLEFCRRFYRYPLRKKSEPPSGDFLWANSTTRTYDHISKSLLSSNRYLEGSTGLLPAYDEKKILESDTRLLSLGEGASNYIQSLLIGRNSHRKTNSLDEGIIAVDSAYPEPSTESFEPWIAQPLERQPELRKFILSHRLNFRRARYIDLDLRSSGGNKQQLLFDEIIASWSLGMSFSQDIERDIELLKPILKHLKKNGTLRIFPIPDPTQIRYLKTLCEELFRLKLISNYSTYIGELVLPEPVFIIQK